MEEVISLARFNSLERTNVVDSDKAVLEILMKGGRLVSSQLDQICQIENYLLANGRSLHPVLIFLGVSEFYDISIHDMVGLRRADEKARKARRVAIFMISRESDGLISIADIAAIMKCSKSAVGYAIKRGVSCYNEDLDGLRGDVKQIRDLMGRF